MFTGSDLSEAEKVELMEKSEAILRKSDTPDRVSARDGGKHAWHTARTLSRVVWGGGLKGTQRTPCRV